MNAKTLCWLVKREFWEHRGGFVWTPIIISAAFLLLNLMGIIGGEALGFRHSFSLNVEGQDVSAKLRSLDAMQMQQIGSALDLIMLSPSGLIGIVFAFVVFFYCLGALYDDRRDRSILFWKSLPISDTATVLSKAITATLVAPIVVVLCGMITGLAMLCMFTLVFSFHGMNVWSLRMLTHPLQVMGFLIGCLPLYLLWALPTVGWLMLCSAWARTKPFLWAIVMPVALGIILSWFNLFGLFGLNSRWYWREIAARVLFSVVPGGWLHEEAAWQLGTSPSHFAHFFSLSHSYAALSRLDMWAGAAAGTIMLAGAVRLRRWHEDN